MVQPSKEICRVRVMAKRGWAARAVAALRQFLQQTATSISSSSTAPPNTSLAFTAIAGLVIAAALGGTLLFSLSRRKRKRSPLTPKQWFAAFDSVSGRLINQLKVLETIRFGGIDPSIRAEVWPFLLGVYELDNTREEQESEKHRKRELYVALKLRCNILRHNIHAGTLECQNGNESTEISSDSPSEEQKNGATLECENLNESREVSSDGLSSPSEEQKNAATSECENTNEGRGVSSDGLSSPSEEQKNVATSACENTNESREVSSDGLSSPSEGQKNVATLECENANESREVSSDGLSSPPEERKNAALASDDSPSSSSTEDTENNPEELSKMMGGPPVEKDKVALDPENASTPGNSNEGNVKDEELVQTKSASVLSKAAHADLKIDCWKATDDFINCQRIIRLDAVRMNAEWVPYSPSQASVSKELAFELARTVDLKDDEHLEPCRQHHAARLVAILEAYALYDPKTGYCQGMSDLLSPFVALLDEDYEAFWCFVEFMRTACYNFQSDETGIRRQLKKISSIFRAADPRLYSHFESIDEENCFFVHRMVVVLLRRALTFEQAISLWEVIWAENRALSVSRAKTTGDKISRKTFLTEDLILFVIAAAVRQRRKVIIEKCTGMGDLLQECNSMAGHLDVWKLLNDAREMAYAIRRQLSDQ